MTGTGDEPKPAVDVEAIIKLRSVDLHDLCDATEAAILEGGGFGWLTPPDRNKLERYWQGVLAVPSRTLIVGRLDGTIAGSVQILRPPPNNEAQAFAVTVTSTFVSPWARGHGIAQRLLDMAEQRARDEGFLMVQLDCRETQSAAIHLYKQTGYVHWGTMPHYARVDGRSVAGLYFYKVLDTDAFNEFNEQAEGYAR